MTIIDNARDNARARKKRARLRADRIRSGNTCLSKAGAVIRKRVDPIEMAIRAPKLVKLMRLWSLGAAPGTPSLWKATQFRLLGMSRATGLRVSSSMS